MRYPIDDLSKFNITAGNSFGAKVPYGYHSGNDVNGNGGGNTDLGTPLKAIAGGLITSVIFQTSGYGNHLHLRFSIGGKDYWAHYCHCQKIYVSAGQTIREGDLIATLGNTGNSNYAHLHLEIKNQPTGVDGIARTLEELKKWENPWEFIKKKMVQPIGDDVKLNQVKSVVDGAGSPTEKITKIRAIVK